MISVIAGKNEIISPCIKPVRAIKAGIGWQQKKLGF